MVDGEHMTRYVETYNDVIRDAQYLPPEILNGVTVPEAIYAPPAYLAANTRVLIMGSEAHGGGDPLSGAVIDTTALERLAWKEKFFQEKAVGKHYFKPFWNQFDWIAKGFGLSGREAIAWSNVCRVQRVKPVGTSYAPDAKIPLYDNNFGATRVKIGEWQSPLVKLEWEALMPDVVIVSASEGHRWLSKTFPNITRHNRSIGKFRVEIWDNLPVPTIGIRHPAYGRDAPPDVQTKLIELVKDVMGRA